MKLRLVRHATLLVEVGGRRLLVDPMLSDACSLPSIEGSANDRRNPLVELPSPASEVVAGVDVVLVTHTHTDHLDDAAVEALPDQVPLLCQPPDEGTLRGRGFSDVRPVADRLEIDGLQVTRTGGRHGSGEIGEEMGPVSGFVVEAVDEPTLYVAGDTIWCEEVRAALGVHRPDIVVVNAGAARFTEGDPITMAVADVLETAGAAADARVVAVHMEAINHCLLTRTELREELQRAGAADHVLVPADGEAAAL